LTVSIAHNPSGGSRRASPNLLQVNLTRHALAVCAGAALLAGCGALQQSPTGDAMGTAEVPQVTAGSHGSPIQHVVLMIQENRTFNNFFATYAGADGTTTGVIAKDRACHIRQTKTIALQKSNLVIYPRDLDHKYQGYEAAYDGGKMDGFDKVTFGTGQPECTYPYQYTNPSQIAPYWDMAEQYTLAEHMFTTQGSSSFVAHQDLIRGSTQINATESIVNDPSLFPWGCDAPKYTKTSLITEEGVYEGGKGPFPCTTDFPLSYDYATLRDLLDAKGVSWKYYVPPLDINFGGLMDAFDVIAPVRYGSEWKTNVARPQTKIFTDISHGALPAVSWVIPDEPDSDHPGEKIDDGPSWVASVVNAIGQSSYWNSTAIIIVWDDWGGLYDNIPPKQLGFGGLGFRVPAIIISPYAKAGHISKTDYEFGSILKYIENNWQLGSLGTTDKRAKSIIDCFDYSQSPIPFTVIPSKHGKSYFIHRKPSYLPIDDDM
jgi:phospholipase C